jgi:prevent-host-death family protein
VNSVTIHKAKTELSKLIALVEAGEDVLILRRDKPVARLTTPEKTELSKRKPGGFPELKNIPDDLLFGPLSDEELDLWEARK